MLRLFDSIFGSESRATPYPAELIRRATDRAVEGTDPWLRGMMGYRRKLRPAVINAIDHVVALVDGLENPLELSRGNYPEDPELQLFFVSAEQVESLVRADPELNAYRSAAGQATGPVWALLIMECEKRQSFGVELRGDTVVRDVAQTMVSMAGHRLIDPTSSQDETRRLLKRRAFDHLLALALETITAVQEVREDLLQHRELLQSKLGYLQRGDWGFGSLGREVPAPVAKIQELVTEVDRKLDEVGGDDQYLKKNLEIVIDVLAGADSQLWAEPLPIIVDRMGIERASASEDEPELVLTQLQNSSGKRFIARLVMVPSESADFGGPGTLH